MQDKTVRVCIQSIGYNSSTQMAGSTFCPSPSIEGTGGEVMKETIKK
jgi:hypothetical protein